MKVTYTVDLRNKSGLLIETLGSYSTIELALECLNKNARHTMDALQIDNMNRAARGGLIGE